MKSLSAEALTAMHLEEKLGADRAFAEQRLSEAKAALADNEERSTALAAKVRLNHASEPCV